MGYGGGCGGCLCGGRESRGGQKGSFLGVEVIKAFLACELSQTGTVGMLSPPEAASASHWRLVSMAVCASWKGMTGTAAQLPIVMLHKTMKLIEIFPLMANG